MGFGGRKKARGKKERGVERVVLEEEGVVSPSPGGRVNTLESPQGKGVALHQGLGEEKKHQFGKALTVNHKRIRARGVFKKSP